jgi:predicted metal-dependent hydrolase
LIVGGLTFEVRRSERRRTLGLTVDRNCELLVHAPVTAANAELESWIHGKLLWVHSKLAIKAALAPKLRGPEYVTGETFHYLGQGYRLAVVDDQEEPLHFNGNIFALRRNALHRAADYFREWYIAAGCEWISKRVELLRRVVPVSPSRIEVRDLGYRWGSCGKNGTVYFNWRLIQLSARLADYVIHHELAHLSQHNHGPAFWALLDSVQPDWRDRKEELAVHAQTIRWFGMFDCMPIGIDQVA